MKKLKDTTELIGEDVAHQLEKISSESAEAVKRSTVTFADIDSAEVLERVSARAGAGATDDGEDSKAGDSEVQSNPSNEKTARPRKNTSALLRKAAVIVSFRRCLFGETMQSLHDAVQEVSQAAVHAGHQPIDDSSLNLDERDRPPTPPPDSADKKMRTAKSGKQHWGRLRTFSLMTAAAEGSKRRSVLQRSLVEDEDAEKPSQAGIDGADAETDVPSTADTLLPSTADSLGSPRVPRRIRLFPKDWPAIGDRSVILPCNVEDVVFPEHLDCSTGTIPLQQRLKCPYPMIPLMPRAPNQLPPLKNPKGWKRVGKKIDETRCTLEGVIAERESRGIRGEADADEEDADDN